MLVLSRRPNEKIYFPTINTTIQIVSLKSGAVRVGIDAPASLPVYRAELYQRAQEALPSAVPSPVSLFPEMLAETLHQMNNHLNSSTIGVALLRRQLDLQMTGEMVSTIGKVEQELVALKQSIETLANAAKPLCADRPRRALLVEDDVNEAELLAGFLRLAGVQVDLAGDGSDALEYLAKNEKPDVVLLDMFLPRFDGPSTVRAIRENPQIAGVRIFGVTGQMEHTKFGLPEGPDGIDRWFRKPLNPEVLLQELTTLSV